MGWAEGFIAVDWGTTNRRAYMVGAGGRCAPLHLTRPGLPRDVQRPLRQGRVGGPVVRVLDAGEVVGQRDLADRLQDAVLHRLADVGDVHLVQAAGAAAGPRRGGGVGQREDSFFGPSDGGHGPD